MKKIILTLAMAFMLISACEQPPQPTTPQRNTVCFIDKSDGTYSENVLTSMDAKVEAIVNDALLDAGDILTIYFMHRSTALKDHLETFTLEASVGPNFHELPDHEKTARQEAFEFERDLEIEAVVKSFQEALRKQPPVGSSTTTQTDVWASIPIIVEELDTGPPGATLEVYYLSDMLHNTDQRSLYRNSPDNAQQARDFAIDDYGEMCALWPTLQGRTCDNLKVQVVYPQTNLNDALHHATKWEPYWTALFGQFGMTYRIYR